MTLLAPLFLAGLLAIGLPIWLHRLSSENPNRKPFSSLMFLEAGEPQRVLAKNVQYLLLLALRETALMGTLLAVHLGFVAGLFITMPYGKFIHMLYRYAALVKNAIEQSRGSSQ